MATVRLRELPLLFWAAGEANVAVSMNFHRGHSVTALTQPKLNTLISPIRLSFAGVRVVMRVRTLSLPTLSWNNNNRKRKETLMSRDAACHEANLTGLAEQETHRKSPAPIYIAFAVGALVMTVAWITLLLYGASRFIAWIAA